MLQVGCGSVGLIFPCAIIGAAKHAVATTKNRKFFIWTSSLVSVLAIVSEKRCEYIYQIEEILKLDGSEMGFRRISKFFSVPEWTGHPPTFLGARQNREASSKMKTVVPVWCV